MNEFFIGDDAISKIGLLNYSYPIEHGIIKDWDNIDKIYEYIFNNKLRVGPKEYKIMILEPLMNPRKK